jgi:hypothetical protein
MRKVYRYECLQHKKKEISNKKPKWHTSRSKNPKNMSNTNLEYGNK